MLATWDPFRDLASVEAEVDRLIGLGASRNEWAPALNVRESADRLEVASK